jgi:hypothetical protein
MRTGMTAQTFGILVTLTSCLILVLVPHGDSVDTAHSPARDVFPRQATVSAPVNTSPAAAASPATSDTPTSQAPATTSAAAPASSTAQAQPPTTSATPSTTAQQQPTSQAPATTPNSASNVAATTTAAVPTTVTSALVTTNQGGQVITSIIVVVDTPTPSAPPSQSSASSSDNSGGGGDSGLSTSTIIALSVAGGVAVLCVVGFFVWKFTRKRIGDYENSCVFPLLRSHLVLTNYRRRGNKMARTQRTRCGHPPANKPHGWSRIRYRPGSRTRLDWIRTLYGS